ncbi:MAG: hypothetical protein ABIR71_14260 [Chthoniobacterales bacterium]
MLLLGLLCAAVGCNKSDDSITAYRAPKEVRPETGAQQPAPEPGAPAGLHWLAPSSWEEQPASGFRKGSFLVRGGDGQTADVSVISFPEAAGGTLANVNRWREQLKLPPVTEEAQAGSSFPVAGHDMLFVELASEQPLEAKADKTRVLGGIYPAQTETWFFKMTGPDELVAAQREPFKEFLQSVHEEGGAPHATASGDSTNAPTPPLIDTLGAVPLQYTLPPGWKEKPLTPMRVASFNASAPNGKEVDISVVYLMGEAGGDLANVNRWRDQVKLPPIDEPGLQQSAERVETNGHNFLVVDLASSEPIGEPAAKQRIVAAILDDKGRSWFIKMTGEDAAVASQKSAFADFLHTLKFH